MIEKAQIQRVLDKLAATEADLSDPVVLADAKLYRQRVREHASLKKLEASSVAYFKLLADLEGNKALLEDPDFAEMAKEEVARIEGELPDAERAVLAGLLKPDPLDSRNAVFELRAGTGGDEAALFAAVLFRMYSRYCEIKGWKVNVMSASETELGGYKEIIFTIVGEGAYSLFRYESGGHRVQRVPETEQQGRIHTSAATVIVFPEADEDDELEIPDKDIRIDIFCAGGHGGQGVNTTYSAIRMTHLPTGLVAQCQDERSQQRNKEKCLATLKARILDQRRREEEAKAGASRMSLRGSGDRSERIRTYNFPQNRLTDHRIEGMTLYSLDRIVEGEMDEVLTRLRSFDLEQRVATELSHT